MGPFRKQVFYSFSCTEATDVRCSTASSGTVCSTVCYLSCRAGCVPYCPPLIKDVAKQSSNSTVSSANTSRNRNSTCKHFPESPPAVPFFSFFLKARTLRSQLMGRDCVLPLFFFFYLLPLIFSFHFGILYPSDLKSAQKLWVVVSCVFFCVRTKPVILDLGLKKNYTMINSDRFPSPPNPTVPSVCLQTCFPSGCDTCLFSRKEHAAGYSSIKNSC